MDIEPVRVETAAPAAAISDLNAKLHEPEPQPEPQPEPEPETDDIF